MNYEFYFLKETGAKDPEVLRVIAPSYENAAAIVARRYGCPAAPEQRVWESIAIRPIEIQNVFARGVPSMSPL